MQITHPDDLELDVAEFERVMRGEAEGYVMDKRFIHKDGGIIDVAIIIFLKFYPLRICKLSWKYMKLRSLQVKSKSMNIN